MRFITRQLRAVVLVAVLVAAAVGTAAAQTGTFTDSRDGKTYKTVKIGGKTWLAENLNHQPKAGKSWCYDNNADNCNKYGRLYDLETAKKVCPTGWHLSTGKEWDDLSKAIGGKREFGYDEIGEGKIYHWSVAGKKLKAKSGWGDDDGDDSDVNGTDDFGFSALPGGYSDCGDSFEGIGNYGVWAVDNGKPSTPNAAIGPNRMMFGQGMGPVDGVQESSWDVPSSKNARSVRCVQNN